MRIGLQNGGTTQWLAGEPGVSERVHSSARDYTLTGERQLEVVPFVKGLVTRQFDRRNQSNEVTFGTTRTFSTADLCFLYTLDYLADIPLTGTLVLQIDTPNGGYKTRLIANAVMQRPEMDAVGVSLALDYTVTGGAITTGPTYPGGGDPIIPGEGVGHYLTGSGDAYLNAAGDFYLTGT